MRIADTVRFRDSQIFRNLVDYGQWSLRKIAKATGLSKDSVARGLATLKQRNKHPESYLWETEEGVAWLYMMVLAVIYVFGLKGNQGAERLSEFFKRIRIDTHVGVSPNAIRKVMRAMEEKVVEYQQIQEASQKEEGGEGQEIVGSGDETFFNGKMILVLMDLISGYLIVEAEAENRSYETWQEKAETRLQELGLRVRHFISDRGKSLVKLATAGFGCLAGADMFHAQYDISKWLGCALRGKLGRASKELQAAEEKLVALVERRTTPEEISEQEQLVEQCQTKLRVVTEGKEAYQKTQQTVSTTVHAFSLVSNQPQTSEQVESHLEKEAQQFVHIAEEQSVVDKKDVVGKFRRQIEDVASIVDVWWLWTEESLALYELNEEVRNWLVYALLPVIYWHHQLHKTQNKELKEVYTGVWQRALVAYQAHPLTATMLEADLEHWLSWAEWAGNNFHRTSSAVEGRNGCLSLCYHHGRGLSSHRLRALTVIHNYDTYRRDGTTPAQRLYGKQFPDLFAWIVAEMESLPLSRQSRQRVVKNPLVLQTVAA